MDNWIIDLSPQEAADIFNSYYGEWLSVKINTQKENLKA